MNSQKAKELQQESVTEQTNVEKANNLKSTSNIKEEAYKKRIGEDHQLIKRWEVANSPFTIVKTEAGYKVTWGIYSIGEWKETLEEAKDDATFFSYNKMITMMNIMLSNYDNMQKINNLKVK